MTRLETGKIPTAEPTIHVGLILPEDSRRKLNLRLESPPAYTLQTGTTPLKGDSLPENLHLSIEDHSLKLDGVIHPDIKELQIIPYKQTLNKSAVHIDAIPAGRGFHWQKSIAVAYRGAIHVKMVEDRLVVINALPLETYLQCVATSEMNAACPKTLLEVQTIVARSWILAKVEQKHTLLGIDVCNDDCCQRYQGINHQTPEAIEASRKTAGKVLVYGNKIVDARYSKSCGGMTERFENVWVGPPQPYFRNLPDLPENESSTVPDLTDEKTFRKWILDPPKAFCSPNTVPESRLGAYLGSVDEHAAYYRWNCRYTNVTLTKLLQKKTRLDVKLVKELLPLERGGSGRIKALKVDFLTAQDKQEAVIIESEYEIRRILHPKFLFSSAFLVEHFPGGFLFRGAGWGHGVGLCQIGALGMALKEYSTGDILRHYYPGTELKNIY